jgi:hypothetical protein
MSYVTVTELRDFMDPQGAPDSSRDALLAVLLETASQQIDRICRRTFTTGTAGEVRYYTATDRGRVEIDDAIAITEIATDDNMDRTYSTVWSNTDYELAPRNALARNRPYTWIQITPNGNSMFPFWRDSVRVKGTFGWSTVPAEVTTACKILAYRLFRRQDTPNGILDNPATLQMRALPENDPDVVNLLSAYIKYN